MLSKSVLAIGEKVVFDCYNKDWKATLGEVVGFEVEEISQTAWVWLKCCDGSLAKRRVSDLIAGLIRKLF